MNIRVATSEHLRELAPLQKQYMDHHIALDNYFACKDTLTEMWLDYAQRLIESSTDRILIAVQDEQIVGYMTGHIRSKIPVYQIEQVGQIGDNYVKPQFRRQGIFTRLLHAMIDWMKGFGVEYIEHPVAVKNAVGRTAWQQRGFEDLYVMTKKRVT